MEYAGSPFEIKELSDGGAIEGLLAGFGNVDRGGDKLLAGCLTKSLSARTAPLPMLFAHDLRRPIGAWKEWREQADGLHVKGTITLATRDGQEAYALAKDGALNGLSIGWNPLRHAIDQKGIRLVSEAEVLEGSLVPVPLNDRTRVSAVKAITGARDLEDLLHEAGFSGRKAKHAASVAWKALNDNPDNEQAELAELSAILAKSTARLSTKGK